MSRRGIDMTVPPSAISNAEGHPLEGLFLSSKKVSFIKIPLGRKRNTSLKYL